MNNRRDFSRLHLNIRYVICKTPKLSAFAEITVLPYHYFCKVVNTLNFI